MTTRKGVSKTMWIGREGAAFKRVSATFVALGYDAPSANGMDGMYVSNLMDHYRHDLTETEIAGIVEWALKRSMGEIQSWRTVGLSLRDDIGV